MKFFPTAFTFLLSTSAILAASALGDTQAAGAITLKEAARGKFHVGAAINTAQITGRDKRGDALLLEQFDSISPENCLKWERVHPRPGHYDFALPDAYVKFGVDHKMFVVGHTLMWHNQTPEWVFKNDKGEAVSKEELLKRLREHIATVVGRYRGKIGGWDVVNEAIDDNGQLRRDTPWYGILGEEGVFAAFEAAHQADPDAELYYNEYSLDNVPKRDAVLKLVKAIRARGLRIDAVGLQEHYLLTEPSAAAIDGYISAFANAGFKVMVTELDVTMLPRPNQYFGADIKQHFERRAELDPYEKALPADRQQALADRYAKVFAIYAKHHANIKRVTLWGVSDAQSWLNDWPILHRTDYPLLFDRDYRPKPAFNAAVKALQSTQ
ncbi:MAG TPA: endo-1,4-beta-xylanase [Opitutaceae bacterium]|nr:endo-1,4-beta-xylanase [Opitutaceae bacterium]